MSIKELMLYMTDDINGYFFETFEGRDKKRYNIRLTKGEWSIENSVKNSSKT
jgi:hypothetical protein